MSHFIFPAASLIVSIGCGSEQQWLASPSGVIDVTVGFFSDPYKCLCRCEAIWRGSSPWNPFVLCRKEGSYECEQQQSAGPPMVGSWCRVRHRSVRHTRRF